MGFLKRLFGDYSTREIKRIQPLCDMTLALESYYKNMSDEELKQQTARLKDRLANGEKLDALLPDAYAICREATDRVLGTPHFPVQILGGIILHQGRIAEMKTGEGKTQTVILPAYLNALTGNGVHVVTVNEYLAKRDSEWMGKVFNFLGLTVGLIVHDMTKDERREAYAADITYGTNNEFGFDYLRDNMVVYQNHKVQRGHAFAIVDEVDSILIDEARTPLIISGQGDKSTDLYQKADAFVRRLSCTRIKEMNAKENQDKEVNGDYIVDEKARTATLTQAGVKKAEKAFDVENLMDPENVTLLHHINQAIKAHGVMHRDVDYIVKDDQVLIVDEFTGRIMFGRRYNEGLHQAIEAKEHVKVARESRTLATITFQNYFRLYRKLSGMTGTAKTEETEFQQIYKLDVVEIPTNKPVIRQDMEDVVYRTEAAKLDAVVKQIEECHSRQQPVLVGTVSIEKSEKISDMLKARGIPHEVLNAKAHEREALIVAQAGKLGAVTIATNMAGRGTDIKLGGNAEYLAKDEMRRRDYAPEMIELADGYGETDNEEVLAARALFRELESKYRAEIEPEAEKVRQAGGLFILGTERHESRRIDNQLRGRSGRQGDPGTSRFFLSTDDDLLRLFGGERMNALIGSFNVKEDLPLEYKMLTNVIETAQQRIEERNFGIRRDVLQYDDVMNSQREMIYGQRDQVLADGNVRESIMKMIDESIANTVERYLPASVMREEWDFDGLRQYYGGWLCREDDFRYTPQQLEDAESSEIVEELTRRAHLQYEQKEEKYGAVMREVERSVLLRNVDRYWMDHIDNMDELRRGIHLRAYGQKDPVVQYRIEGYDMFEAMVDAIREDTARMMMTVELRERTEPQREQVMQPTATSGDGTVKGGRKVGEKVGRNDPCPCGSGKKYKNCCGK